MAIEKRELGRDVVVWMIYLDEGNLGIIGKVVVGCDGGLGVVVVVVVELSVLL